MTRSETGLLPDPKPRVSVVIPTWNGWELLRDAIRSLHSQIFREFEIIVVDNASTDGTVAHIADEFPSVRAVSLRNNLGFAAAVNAGIVAASGEIVVLMNNDVEAEAGWLEALVAVLDGDESIGSCASKMLQFKQRTMIDSAGVQLGLFASDIGRGKPDGEVYSVAREVFGACAGAAAYRKAVLYEVGLFDESMFAYFEDVDVSARLQYAGYRCMYVPSAVVYHHGSATANRMPAMKFYLLMRNALTLFFRYAPRRRLMWTPVMLALPFFRAVVDRQPQRLALRAVKDCLRETRSLRAARVRVRTGQRISDRDFARRLASPLARSGR